MNEYTRLLLIFNILIGVVKNMKMEKTKMIVIGSGGSINDYMYLGNPLFGDKRDHDLSWNLAFKNYGIPYDNYKISYNKPNIFPGSVSKYFSRKLESEKSDSGIIQADIGYNGSKFVISDSKISDFDGGNKQESNLTDMISDEDGYVNKGIANEFSEISPEFKGPIFNNYKQNNQMLKTEDKCKMIQPNEKIDNPINSEIITDYPLNVVFVNSETKEPSYDTIESIVEPVYDKEGKKQNFESQDNNFNQSKDSVIDKDNNGLVIPNNQDNSQTVNTIWEDTYITKNQDQDLIPLDKNTNTTQEKTEINSQDFKGPVWENYKDNTQAGNYGKTIIGSEVDKEILLPTVDSKNLKDHKFNDFNQDYTPVKSKNIMTNEYDQQNHKISMDNKYDNIYIPANTIMEEFKFKEFKSNQQINDFTTPETLELYEISDNKCNLFGETNQIEINKEFRGPVFETYKSNNSMDKYDQHEEITYVKNESHDKIIVDNNDEINSQSKNEVEKVIYNLENKSNPTSDFPSIFYVQPSNQLNIITEFAPEDDILSKKEDSSINKEFRGPAFDNYKNNERYSSEITTDILSTSVNNENKNDSSFEIINKEHLINKEFKGPVFDNFKQPFETESISNCEVQYNKYASDYIFGEKGQYQNVNQEFRGPIFDNYKENTQFILHNSNENINSTNSYKEEIPFENELIRYNVAEPNLNSDTNFQTIQVNENKKDNNQPLNENSVNFEPLSNNEPSEHSNNSKEEGIFYNPLNSLQSSTPENKESDLDANSTLSLTGKNVEEQVTHEDIKPNTKVNTYNVDYFKQNSINSETIPIKDLPNNKINKNDAQSTYVGFKNGKSDTNPIEDLGLNYNKATESEDIYNFGNKYPSQDNPEFHTDDSYFSSTNKHQPQSVQSYYDSRKHVEIQKTPTANYENSYIINSPQSEITDNFQSPSQFETITNNSQGKEESATNVLSTGSSKYPSGHQTQYSDLSIPITSDVQSPTQLISQTDSNDFNKIPSGTTISYGGTYSDMYDVNSLQTRTSNIQNASKSNLKSPNEFSTPEESNNFSNSPSQINSKTYFDTPSIDENKNILAHIPTNDLQNQSTSNNTLNDVRNQNEKTTPTSENPQLDNREISSDNKKTTNEVTSMIDSKSNGQLETPNKSSNSIQTQGNQFKMIDSESTTTYSQDDSSSNINSSTGSNYYPENHTQDNMISNKNDLSSPSKYNEISTSNFNISASTSSNPTNPTTNLSKSSSDINEIESAKKEIPDSPSMNSITSLDQMEIENSQNNPVQINGSNTKFISSTDKAIDLSYNTISDNIHYNNHDVQYNQITTNEYPLNQSTQPFSDNSNFNVIQQDKASIPSQISINQNIDKVTQADKYPIDSSSTLSQNTQHQILNIPHQETLIPTINNSQKNQPEESNSNNNLITINNPTSLQNHVNINKETQNSQTNASIPFASESSTNKPAEILNQDSSSKNIYNINDISSSKEITGAKQSTINLVSNDDHSKINQNQDISPVNTQTDNQNLSNQTSQINKSSSSSYFPINKTINVQNNLTESSTSHILNSGTSTSKAEDGYTQTTSTGDSLSSKNAEAINTLTGQLQSSNKNNPSERSGLITNPISTSENESLDKQSSNITTKNTSSENKPNTLTMTSKIDNRFNNESLEDVLINKTNTTESIIKDISQSYTNILTTNENVQDKLSTNIEAIASHSSTNSNTSTNTNKSPTKELTSITQETTNDSSNNQIETNTPTQNINVTEDTRTISIRNAVLNNIPKNQSSLKNVMNVDTTSKESPNETNPSSQPNTATYSSSNKQDDHNVKFLVSREVPEPNSNKLTDTKASDAWMLNINFTLYILIISILASA